MNKVETAVIGYVAGAIVGGLILLLFLGWVFVSTTEAEAPDFYVNIKSWLMEYHATHSTIFEVAFVLGFLSGIGGSGSAANSQRG